MIIYVVITIYARYLQNMEKKDKKLKNATLHLPSLEEQKETVRLLEAEIRTSFELTEDSIKKIESKARKSGESASSILRNIIRFTRIESNDKNQKRLKNFTIDEFCMDRLRQLGESLIPSRFVGKRGINKSQVVELLIQKHFEQLDKRDLELTEKFGEECKSY